MKELSVLVDRRGLENSKVLRKARRYFYYVKRGNLLLISVSGWRDRARFKDA